MSLFGELNTIFSNRKYVYLPLSVPVCTAIYLLEIAGA